jgi:hypothetical protein
MDSLAQLTGDWWQLTPSVFARCRASGETSLAAPGAFFACPGCGHAPLLETPGALTCPDCSSAWGIQDGIYDFRAPVGGAG